MTSETIMQNPLLQKRLQELGIREYSAIQRSVIPHAEAGEDIFAIAPAGSGKTYAYLIPILECIPHQTGAKHKPSALILSPTRELCTQIAETSRSLLEGQEGIRTALLTGGVDMNLQVRKFSKGADIAVATPSRLLDHLRRHTFRPDQCRILVLDECDEMLSMGFLEQVQQVISEVSPDQIMLFSATASDEVRRLAGSMLKNPFSITIDEDPSFQAEPDLYHLIVPESKQTETIVSLLRHQSHVLIFCNTRNGCDHLRMDLDHRRITCGSIHSKMDPAFRRKLLREFKAGTLPVLIATDVAARGLDLPGLDLVISLGWPDQEEFLIHRISRTARSGKTGKAILLLPPKEKDRISRIPALTGRNSRPFPSRSENRRPKHSHH
ncbi:MAG: DEAD/DEAH box helicase [Bulleidia sp.]